MAGSRPLSTAPEATHYSTLELDNSRWLENDAKAAPIVGQDPKDEKFISYSDDGKQAVIANGHDAQSKSSPPTGGRKIFGLSRKAFFILLAVVLVLIIAVAVGGGVGGTAAARNRAQAATAPTDMPSPISPQTPTTTRGGYENTGLAAMQWTDLNGTLHRRLYYQDNSDKIRESAWDNSSAFDTAWDVNAISNAVKPGTPIAAAAGYPHARQNYTLVRIAYLSFPAIGDK